MQYNTGSPTWDERVSIHNVPLGTPVALSVWDKDLASADDLSGEARLAVTGPGSPAQVRP